MKPPWLRPSARLASSTTKLSSLLMSSRASTYSYPPLAPSFLVRVTSRIPNDILLLDKSSQLSLPGGNIRVFCCLSKGIILQSPVHFSDCLCFLPSSRTETKSDKATSKIHSFGCVYDFHTVTKSIHCLGPEIRGSRFQAFATAQHSHHTVSRRAGPGFPPFSVHIQVKTHYSTR